MPEWADERDCGLLLRKLEASGTRREDYWSGEGRHEVTFAFECFDERLEEYTGPRDYADDWKKAHDPRRWLTGTIDWWRPGWVDDLKTGRWPVHVDTKQLNSYAIYDWKVRGPHNWRCLRSITQWPKYPLAKPPDRNYGEKLNYDDMQCHLDSIRYSLTHPNETFPTEDGCRFCDSRGCCPEWRVDG